MTHPPEDWKPFIRVLIYPIQFDSSPKEVIAKALRQTVETEDWRDSLESFLESIDASLASDQDLSVLIPQQHSDQVIREYLVALKAELLRRKGNEPG